MAKQVEKYNAKARKSSSRPTKKAKHAVAKEGNVDTIEADANASIITPKTKEQKEADRKERLRQEVFPPTAFVKYFTDLDISS